MNRFEKLSVSIYDLIEDVAANRVVARNKTVTMNSLYLLRDALIDLRYTYKSITVLDKQREELMVAQMEARDFGGQLHAQYHDTSGQLRAARVALLQQGKRVLNVSSHVLASMLPHAVRIKDGSFGRQYNSALGLDMSKLDRRSKRLIQNLIVYGPKLEIHNNNRDQYVEHSTPATLAEQPRPAHGTTGLHYMKRRSGFEDVEEMLLGGMVREAMPGYVLIGEPNPKGSKELLTYHIHINHYMVPMTAQIMRSAFLKAPPPQNPTHFKTLEPHTHHFTHPDSGDNDRDTSNDYGIEITELASNREMVRDYCEYIRKLLHSTQIPVAEERYIK